MVRTLVVVVLVVLGAGCGSGASSDDSTPIGRVEIVARSGPNCPVETDPPSPECAPRPVEGAVIVVRDAAGVERVRGVTDAVGAVVLDVPVGDASVEPQAVDGLLGTAAPIAITVAEGQTLQLTADYDTGIR